MKTRFISILLMIVGLIVSVGVAVSQDLNLENMVRPPSTVSDPEQARAQAISNLDEAIAPLLDLFAFYTGGGLYHSAKVHGLGGFDVGVRVVTMLITEDQKPTLPFPQSQDFKPAQGGIFRNVDLMPLPLLQVSIGLPGDLEAMGRFFTYPLGEGEDEGNITLIGLGVKYGLLQNILLPRIAIVASYHYLQVPEKFDFASVNDISAALVISKGFPLIDFYGGIGYDYTTLKVKLQLGNPIGEVNKEYNRGNVRGNVGLKIKPIPFLFIHADYNFGGFQGFNAGLGLSFR
ncbi:MAG: hypothetical protein ONB13_02090 [candidate division KSB1 bacterium]|nr:hypothetical protein [candidate division KSB1 bacterium]MDZ7334449.1 hypothetical protein [candidate division KSB1 bacterium]MDZ7355976.1 hypothetical protein [candidate division KSB1 bacterium]MDZ7375386.1 hypothetical protein [candidate division KSB1 bacterium]MDZ7400690.1 hypothetical protein [candidate division KSB1 bacterium]